MKVLWCIKYLSDNIKMNEVMTKHCLWILVRA